VPLRFRYTQQADYANRLDRYRAVVREAAEQCGRSVLPIVLPAQTYAAALKEQTDAPRLLLDEREHDRSLREAIAEIGALRTIHLFVGPEGGLHPDEREQARVLGMQTVGLGRRILRSETAGVVAATLVLAAAGDLE
jgi:16S rRNA (uracil1498-N3)-methyltransferase